MSDRDIIDQMSELLLAGSETTSKRWLQGDAAESAPKPHLAAYYPVSSGKHSCIGPNFAYAEIRTVVTNILSRFDVHDIQKKAIDFRQFITMQMHDGSWEVILTPRAKTS
ncbi:hypothetical protein MBLNU13_g07111t1 [Cladosporium sp. NU13]